MMVREELIEGAVTFLQDASVAPAPVEQKIAFLRSKNLTQDEIDTSLARIGQPQQTPPQQQQQYRQQPPSQQQYSDYSNNVYQQQQPPPYWSHPLSDPPRRDWRDYFIMATLLGGVGYALYWTAARYITPLIAPPTPPQLEQDKTQIDASFTKAFALLDQLATDTQSLKESEKTRTERLDQALAEVESVIGRVKEANEERAREAKGMSRELGEVREQIPKALERERRGMDEKLEGLVGEMRSLKTLVQGRTQGPVAAGAAQPRANASSQIQMPSASSFGSQSTAPVLNGTPASAPPPPAPAATPAPETDGSPTKAVPADAEKPTSALPERSALGSPYGRNLGGKAQIPDWQLAPMKQSEEAKKDGVGATGTESGTATPVEGKGAEVTPGGDEGGAAS